MKRIFAWMKSNGYTDEENFCTDAVKRMHGLRKFFARMKSNGYTADENFMNGCSQMDTRLTKINRTDAVERMTC